MADNPFRDRASLSLIVRLSLLEELKSSRIHRLRSIESTLRLRSAPLTVSVLIQVGWVARTDAGAVEGRRVSALC